MLWVKGRQRVQQEQVAEMKNLRLRLGKIQFFAIPLGIRATIVEERATTTRHFRHHIGVRCRGLGSHGEKLRVDTELLAVVEDLRAEGVFAHQTGTLQREFGSQHGKIYQHVIRRTTRAFVLAVDIGELFPLGKNVDKFDLVDDPIAAGQNALPIRRRRFLRFHVEIALGPLPPFRVNVRVSGT